MIRRGTNTTRQAAFVALGMAALFTLPSGPVSAQARDEAAMQYAYQVIELAGIKGTVEQSVEKVLTTSSNKVELANPRNKAEVHDAMEKIYAPVVRQRIADIMEALAANYARQFSKDELEQIVKFYQTEAGRKYLAARTRLEAENSQITAKLLQKAFYDARVELDKELAKRGLKTSN